MKRVSLLLAFVSILFISNSRAQAIAVSGNLGWAQPNGEAFDYENGWSGGFNYTLDVVYFLPNFDGKLGAGITYNASLIGGGGESAGLFNVDLYNLNLYGVKGVYRFFKSKVTPYAALSTGLTRLVTPEVSQNDEIILESEKSMSLGVLPEIGLELGGLKLSVAYLVPMKYKTFAPEKQSVGMTQFTIGYRYKFGS